MRTYLQNRVKYNKQFADVMHRLYKQMRYGIDSCKPDQDNQLISMRKELVEWEANEDDGALSETTIQLKTWLGVKYDDVLYSKGGTGYFMSEDGRGPAVGLDYMGTQQSGQNIIEINSGGCITRINLNPAITINQNSSFVFTQQTPALYSPDETADPFGFNYPRDLPKIEANKIKKIRKQSIEIISNIIECF